MKKILVVCAHADDETLGCGGTLLKHREAGDELYWIIATQPWPPKFSEDFIRVWNKQIDAVAEGYGMVAVHRLGFPATRLDTVNDSALIDQFVVTIQQISPDIVYIVHPGDSHADHQFTYHAAMVALKPFAFGKTTDVFAFETISSTNVAPVLPGPAFVPQHYVDISTYLDRKIELLSLFKTEMFDPPHPRSLEAVKSLARYRGSSVFVDYAEAYAVIRTVK